MCSIIGVVGENVKSDIINMLHTLKHRGPDGCGVYSRGKIYLNNDILDCEDSSFIIAHNFYYLLLVVMNYNLHVRKSCFSI